MSAKFDTSECYFDPAKFGGAKKIDSVYPETSVYPEFKKGREAEIKIAILLSDFKSPFLKIKDHKQRVESIFSFLKVKTDVVANRKMLEDVVAFKSGSIFSICAAYIEIQNNDEFAYWWNLNQLYYSLMAEMGRPREEGTSVVNDVKMKLSIQKQADEIKQTLADCATNLFGTAEMKMAVARAKLDKEKTRTYAEKYAIMPGGPIPE